MYRLLKTTRGLPDGVLQTRETEDEIVEVAITTVLEHASNGDEFSGCDIQVLREQLREEQETRVGPTVYSIDNVDPMTDEQVVAAGGGVCKHCHTSDDVEPGELEMGDGFVSRLLECSFCGGETTEQYSLSGSEE